MNNKIIVKMTPHEKMQYNTYLVKINECHTTLEIIKYHKLATKLVEKAITRSLGLYN